MTIQIHYSVDDDEPEVDDDEPASLYYSYTIGWLHMF